MIHPREIEVLNILFSTDQAMTSGDIVMAGKRLSQSTVQAVLRKLAKEGHVAVEGVAYSGNVLSRTYRPTEQAKETVKKQIMEEFRTVQHIVSTDELIEELRKGVN